MSKAFKSGDDTPEEPDLPDEPSLPKHTRNYLTPPGVARLRAELKQLLATDRPELVKVISWAASNGDRSENGDYIYGKRRLREIDRRIRFLTKRLEASETVDPLEQGKRAEGKILFGATVTVNDEEGRKRVYRIVGIDEADAGKGWVSWISPLAKALLGSREGDAVTLRTPKGEEELEIVAVRYEAAPEESPRS